MWCVQTNSAILFVGEHFLDSFGPSFVSATRLGQVFIQADACVARRRGQPEPLHYTDRGPFLEVVAERLRGIEVLGDGIVIRVVRQTAAEFFRAPILARAGGSGKYR